MQTSSFFRFRGEGKIAISRYAPRKVRVPVFRALAPGAWFNSVSFPEYRMRYFDQLSHLDPQAVWAQLHDIAQGHEPVLLCYENPPFDEINFCHRRMAAEWFENELGLVVPEWNYGHSVPAPK